jgi:hypothetical protein
MRAVETIPRMKEWRIRGNEGWGGMKDEGEWGRMVEGMNSSLICCTHCENFCKCHNIPPSSTTWKKDEK